MTETQTIYIVDDDEAMRDSMTWLLEGEGYHVACFDSAERFLQSRRDNMRGCLILDVRMPTMSGLELHEKLDAFGSRLPVIFVTGHGDVRFWNAGRGNCLRRAAYSSKVRAFRLLSR